MYTLLCSAALVLCRQVMMHLIELESEQFAIHTNTIHSMSKLIYAWHLSNNNIIALENIYGNVCVCVCGCASMEVRMCVCDQPQFMSVMHISVDIHERVRTISHHSKALDSARFRCSTMCVCICAFI